MPKPALSALAVFAAGVTGLAGMVPVVAAAEEPVDLDRINEIRHEAFHRSRVMDHAQYLTDVIGARLTGSPAMREANEWTRDQLEEWGLEYARLEAFDFGRGWSHDDVSLRMSEPRSEVLIGYPRAWTPGTDGEVTGPVKTVRLEDEADLEAHEGELEGKVLLLDEPEEIDKEESPSFRRHDDGSLERLGEFPIPQEQAGPAWRDRAAERWRFREQRNAFLEEEGVIATLHASSRDFGIVRAMGGAAHDEDAETGVPAVTLATEHYNLLNRLTEDGHEPEIELTVDAQFHDEETDAWNTLAEIPGGRHGEEVVLAGAHLDSWHAGTGATDNAAGVAVVMEAVRILQELEVSPHRTIRVALWSGEEQGLLGSRAYVDRHVATRPDPEVDDADDDNGLPERLREETWPIEPRDGHDTHVVYFNVDNGSGRIRGIHGQENAALRPVFESWLDPFADVGADTVTLRNTGSTDHIPFDNVGIPGFQFIQDPLDYFARTHHSHLDTFDHLEREDLMQASAVLASMLYHAAMRDEPLPRKPMPTEPPEADGEG